MKRIKSFYFIVLTLIAFEAHSQIDSFFMPQVMVPFETEIFTTGSQIVIKEPFALHLVSIDSPITTVIDCWRKDQTIVVIIQGDTVLNIRP